MIKSITLHNIKSYSHQIINFSDGLNVISGESDAGKSNIIRAIRWVCFNEPYGWRPRSWHSDDDAYVVIEFYDGNFVTRGVDSTGGYYIVNGGEKLRALRGALPDAIAKIVNMQSINLQLQNQQYFLFQETPGNAVKAINDIVDTSILDRAIKITKRRIKDRTTSVRDLEARYNEIQQDIEKLQWTQLASSAVDELSKVELAVEGRTQIIDTIGNKISNAREAAQEVLKQAPPIMSVMCGVVTDGVRNLHLDNGRIVNIDKIVAVYKASETELSGAPVINTALPDMSELVDRRRVISAVAQLCESYPCAEELAVLPANINQMFTNIKRQLRVIFDTGEMVKKITDVLQTITETKNEVEELTVIDNKCPLCGNVIN